MIDSALQNGARSYICVAGAHGVIEARRDAEFRSILNNSFLTTPDGMPTVWLGRLQGHSGMNRVFGPDLMLRICALSEKNGYTQFLYGGAPGVVAELKKSLQTKFPRLRIVGTYSPPFRPLNAKEEAELEERISLLRPDIIWIGLSTPKQERFMAEHVGRLDTKLMFGVGAAFDYHTGRIQDAPQWVKRLGLQWLHRLVQEPRRLWSRYLIIIPKFLVLGIGQIAGLTHYPADWAQQPSFENDKYQRS